MQVTDKGTGTLSVFYAMFNRRYCAMPETDASFARAVQFSSGKPKLAKMHIETNIACCIFAQTVGLPVLALTAHL